MGKQIGIRIFPGLIALIILHGTGQHLSAAPQDLTADHLLRKGIQPGIVGAVDGILAPYDEIISKISDRRHKHQHKQNTGQTDLSIDLSGPLFYVKDFFFFFLLRLQGLPHLFHIFARKGPVSSAPVFFLLQYDQPHPALKYTVPG